MELFIFSSVNLTNIWAGLGARLWAVSQREGSRRKELATKAARMQIGSLGLLWCSAPDVQALTTPFIVYSNPDPSRTVVNVWPEPWIMAFRIHPLGNPNMMLSRDDAMKSLPVLKDARNISHELNLQPTTVFVPTQISADDWAIIVERLAE